MESAAIILTYPGQRELSDLLCAALSRFMPHVTPVVLDSTATWWETDVPPRIRALIKAGDSHYHICLRRVFDAPAVVKAKTFYVLDADCFLFGPLDDWGPCAFMGSWAGPDADDRLAVWRELGYEIPNPYPCLCAGTCSYPRELLLQNRDLAVRFLDAAVKLGFYRPKHRGAALDNAFVAGLWKLNYAPNILPKERYAYIKTTPEMVLYHAGCGVTREPRFQEVFLPAYRHFLLRGGPKEPLIEYRP